MKLYYRFFLFFPLPSRPRVRSLAIGYDGFTRRPLRLRVAPLQSTGLVNRLGLRFTNVYIPSTIESTRILKHNYLNYLN